MAISFVAAGLAANGTGILAPGLPTGTAADDLMLYPVEIRSTGAAPALSGWVKQADILVTAGAEVGGNGTDTGTAHMILYTRVFVAGDTIPSFTPPDANGGRAEVFTFRRSAGSGWDMAFATGTDSTIDTAHSAAATTDPGGAAGDMLVAFACTNGNDIGTAHTAVAGSWTGCTLGTISEADKGSTTAGNDELTVIKYVPITAGTSSGNPSITWTWSGTTHTNHPATAVAYARLRELTTTIISADASLPATGSVAADAQLVQLATATTAAAGTISAAATVIKDGAASVGAVGTISAAALIITSAAATIPATGTISANATVVAAGPATILADATIPAIGSIAAAGTVVKDGAATVQATSTITAAALVIRAATATIPATGSIVGQAVQVRVATAQLTAAGAITGSGILVQQATATVSATGTINAVAVVASPLPEVGTWDTSAGSSSLHDAAGAALSAHDATGHTSNAHDGAGAAQAAHEAAGTLVGTHEGA